jgi:hypothetical protein
MTNVTTRSYSNYRDGSNLNETTFTQASVKAKGLHHLFDVTFDDDERGSEGQPLIVQNLIMGDGNVHDVLFTLTMGNSVFADDANTGERLWREKLGNPIPSSLKLDMWGIADNWGGLSTPVIDTSTNTIYVVVWSDPNGSSTTAQYYLHALSLIDGSQKYAPVNLNAASYTPPVSGLAVQYIKTVPRKQRCALALDVRNGFSTVFVCFGSFDEDADTNQGWIIACDVSLNKQPRIAGTYTTSAKYSGPGTWMAGQGPSITDDGHILFMTGNGAFDPPTDFGESFLRVSFTPDPDNVSMGSMSIVSWYSPFTDTGRVGGDPTVASTDLLPSSEQEDNPVGGTSNMNSPDDEDLGSGGPLYIPMSITGYTKNVIVGAGKDGILYVVDADSMGDTALADFAPDKISTNYAKLLSPPYGFTAYFGNTNLAPTQLDQLPTTYGGKTHHQHSTPVYYNSPKYGPMLFTGGENGPVRAFQFNSDFTLTYLATGLEIASAAVSNPGGMPGTMMTLSANGDVANTGILWCIQPYGDANKVVTNGRLLTYAADNFENGIMVPLWDSEVWNQTFLFNKFNVPTICNGKLYLPTYGATTKVYA